MVESGSGCSSSRRSKGVMVKRGEEGEVGTEKREEEREAGRGLVREESVDWVAAAEGGRNWGKTNEGGMCSWGRPGRMP